ncbi:MAG: IS1634 family transposase, partial [Desulfobacterales bacterium]|nr:IS1634 family transposase [Desulfobacterales bacterium]
MYITNVPNRGSKPTTLLRESYRAEKKVKTRTLANLSHLPDESIDLLRRQLKGEKFFSADKTFKKVDSWHHGHVDAVRRAMKRLGFDKLISSRHCPERDLVVAMVMGRILEPDNNKNSKLANPRWWQITTLPSMLNVQDATEDDLYAAMDWLLKRQDTIEKKLAKRHLNERGQVLFDLSSSYFEGTTCPLAARGKNRDDKKNKLQVNYGLLTDNRGCPVAVSVFDGNTSDTKTLMPQVDRIRKHFKIKSVALVGDRGMITQKLIDEKLRDLDGIDWITALRTGAIKNLVTTKQVQLELFDEQNLFELIHPDYPDERLVACRNPELAKLRTHKRKSLIDATIKNLQEIYDLVERNKLRGKDKIDKRLDKIIKQYKLADHFSFSTTNDGFDFHIDSVHELTKASLHGFCTAIEKVRSTVKKGKLFGKDKIKKKVEKIINQYNATEHIDVEIYDDDLRFSINDSNKAAEAALDSFYQELEKVRILINQGKYGGKDNIGIRIGKIINKYKVAKHIILNIRDDGFEFQIDEAKVKNEASLDGIYIIRT